MFVIKYKIFVIDGVSWLYDEDGNKMLVFEIICILVIMVLVVCN